MLEIALAGIALAGSAAALLLVYPGELSQLSRRWHRWLYDTAARRYEKKWLHRGYQDTGLDTRIRAHARQGLHRCTSRVIVDLGCGTGRAIDLLQPVLDPDCFYLGMDFSPKMLALARVRLQASQLNGALIEMDLARFRGEESLKQKAAVVVMLEVSEFVTDFPALIKEVAQWSETGASLVLSRPAGWFAYAFPGRSQTRDRFTRVLQQAGFSDIQVLSWRWRYEIILATRVGFDASEGNGTTG